MRSKGGDSHSNSSSETAALQKLGFDRNSIQNVFASIMNRMRPSSAVLAVLQELVSFVQILGIGFYSSIDDGILLGNPYTEFLGTILRRSVDLADLFSNRIDGNFYLMILHMILLCLWILLFVAFVIRYNRSKTFSRGVIYLIYAIGFHVFNLNRVIMATSVGFFSRALRETQWQVDSVWCLFTLVFFIGYYTIALFMLRVMQSSPDVDIKNRMSYWPQDFLPTFYRMSIGYALPFLMELLRGYSEIAELVVYIVIILTGIGGMVVIWYKDSNVFPMGRVFASLEYCVLILAPALSLTYRYLGGSSLWYFLAFVVVIVFLGVLFYAIVSSMTKAKIDLLYSKFENLTANITSPQKCISLFKTGIVFNVPCITNHTILNWALARWPNHQPLMLMISFIFYVVQVPYNEVLELVSVAVDIAQLSSYDSLLFSQIFNRLPTRESQLKRKLEGIRRLYELPKNSLKGFWEAVQSRQWEEAVVRCREYQADLKEIERIFSHLIFENPASECLMQEFIKFSMEIQGNYAAACAAEKELSRRGRIEANQMGSTMEGSVTSISQLSSVKSSVFLSDISEIGETGDVIHSGIQASVQARPYFSPIPIILTCFMTALISMGIVVAVFILTEREMRDLDDQKNWGSAIHRMANYITTMFCSALEFSTHDQAASNTVSGTEFNETQWRLILNNLGNSFDDVFAGSFSYASSCPSSFTGLWYSRKVDTMVVWQDEVRSATLSFVASLRIFQLRAKTLLSSPKSYFGSLQQPCAEILEMTYLYPAVSNISSIMVNELAEIVQDKVVGAQKNTLLFIILGCFGFNVLLVFIGIPIICFGIFKEIDFILALYGSIPPKVVSAMLSGESSRHDDIVSEQRKGPDLKKLLPSSMYRIWEIIGILLAILIIAPIPAYIIWSAYKDQRNDAVFAINGIELSCQVVAQLGLLYLHAFRIVTGFSSPLTTEAELRALEIASDAFRESYESILFAQTERTSHGVVYYKAQSVNGPCPSLLGGGIINHSCSSFHSDVYFLYGHVLRLLNMKNPQGIGVDSDWWRLFYPAVYAAIAATFNSISDAYSRLTGHAAHANEYIPYLVVSVVLFLIAVIGSALFVKFRVMPEWQCLLHPILVMDPEHVSESPQLVHFLQGDYDNRSRTISQESKHGHSALTMPLIDFILEGVLVMTSEGVIIASNRKYHEMMSNTEDDVVGSNVRALLPASCQPLFDAMDRIRNGGGEECVSIDTNVFTDADRELPVKIHFVAHLRENEVGTRHTLCAILFVDRSELIKSQAMLRKEKAHVEGLFARLLPQPLVKALESGKSDVSFDVQNACVLIANIVSFNSMCAKMSAKAIINTLNSIFIEFDSQVARFSRVAKVKTMGDSYICVAGVFEGDGPIEAGANELAEFSLAMLRVIDRINREHNESIHLRVGLHAGGPLIVGVVGKDRPLFEVLGLPLAIADELQATCPSDQVHVSATFANLIQGTTIQLTSRDANPKMQFLKGQKTFTIASSH